MLRRAMSSLTSTTIQRRRKPHYYSYYGAAQQQQQQQTKWKTLTTSASSSSDGGDVLEAAVVFKPWGTAGAVVESVGDYRQEMWLEDHIGGRLYGHQKALPRLPVCEIRQTLERFLPTALPLAKSETEAAALRDAAANFPKQAQHLQDRLMARASPTGEFANSSWLQLWWNTLGYLKVRDPVVINVSYFFHFADDPTALTQVQRGAALLTGAAQFRKLACSGALEPESIRSGGKKGETTTTATAATAATRALLCATAYKYMFHACRIPGKLLAGEGEGEGGGDTYRIYDPALHHHAVVAVKGRFFRIGLSDPGTGDPLPVAALEAALHDCIAQAAAADDGGGGGDTMLGWCTSGNRDDWADARTELLRQGGGDMERALRDLESGAVLLCLDDDEIAVSRSEVAKLLLHGSSANGSGGNRWFDKSVQLVVSANGKAGLVGEHSMMDGMPVVRLADHITKTTYAACCSSSSKNEEHDASRRSPPPSTAQPIFSQQLRDKIRGTAAPLVEKAKRDFADLVTNNSLHVQSFQGYGSTFMKQAGYSPDAYVQVVIQLATYRLWGEQVGTYEATQVRPFLHGRTETTRSVSPESAAFVGKLGLRPALDEHDAASRTEKLRLLQAAVAAHVRYTGFAAQAQGVDRHFLGLSLVAHDGEALPDLYSDPVFVRSKRWRVSTSHLTHPKLEGWGYGQVVPDGVGLAYSIHPRHCVFNITARRETGWTDALSHLLEEALLEVRALIEVEQLQAPPVSKL